MYLQRKKRASRSKRKSPGYPCRRTCGVVSRVSSIGATACMAGQSGALDVKPPVAQTAHPAHPAKTPDSMHARKGVFTAEFLQMAFHLIFHVRLRDLRRPILHCLTQDWPCVIPETVFRRTAVEIGKTVLQRPQCIVEHRDVFARLHDAQH